MKSISWFNLTQGYTNNCIGTIQGQHEGEGKTGGMHGGECVSRDFNKKHLSNYVLKDFVLEARSTSLLCVQLAPCAKGSQLQSSQDSQSYCNTKK